MIRGQIEQAPGLMVVTGRSEWKLDVIVLLMPGWAACWHKPRALAMTSELVIVHIDCLNWFLPHSHFLLF